MHDLIYLVRHGETASFSPRRFLGQTDLPLNDNGIRQARALGERLRQIPFTRVLASPLQRAIHTAALVSGQPMETVQSMAALTEIHLGVWEGATVAEVQYRFPGAYEQHGADLEAFNQDGEGALDLADDSETLEVLQVWRASKKAERLAQAWAMPPPDPATRARL